ncbi:MAG TPA: Holliday junction resolvase RuvX [Anaerolineales bacterium]|nr:Holliday junction resolvase RuvX [Anaerolineales bacterium]
MSRVLAVDPGQARLGVAISDPTATVARPLTTIAHTSRQKDAEAVLVLAREQGAGQIVVGVPFDMEGEVGHRARRSLRLVEILRKLSPLPVSTWDESGSTIAAQRGRGPDPSLDARAAAVILQEYLDAQTRA